MQLFIIMAKLRLVFLAMSYHISIAAVIKAKPVFSLYNELVYTAAGVICLSEKPVFLHPTKLSLSCHSSAHVLEQCPYVDCHKNPCFIVFQSLSAVCVAGEMLDLQQDLC